MKYGQAKKGFSECGVSIDYIDGIERLQCRREPILWMIKSSLSGIGTRATQSRQPRQVRKEATVTGSCVCSGPPGIWLFDFSP